MTMDAVASVFGDASLLFALVQRMYRLQAVWELRRAACTCRRLSCAAESTARTVVLWVFAGADVPPTERWSAHAELLASLGLLSRSGGREDLAAPLRHALYAGDPSALPPWAQSEEHVAQAGELVDALVDPRGSASQLLGRRGPLAMLPLQRRLLRRLSFDFGALRRAVDLARLAEEKARGTRLELELALDLADTLNLKASAQAFMRNPALLLEDFDEVLRAMDLAASLPLTSAVPPGPQRSTSQVTLTPRARQLLGRMMASTGRVWLVDTALRPEVEHRLAQRWGDGEALLNEALVVHSRAVELAARRVEQRVLRLRGAATVVAHGAAGPLATLDLERSPHARAMEQQRPQVDALDHQGLPQGLFPALPDLESPLLEEALLLGRSGCAELRAPLLELGECVAGLAECWFCIASVARLVPPDAGVLADAARMTVLDIGAENAANRALEAFEDALSIYTGEMYGPGHLDRTVEYADALKDYGKVITFFFDENDLHAIRHPLPKSVRLHEELLGPAHPRTLNVRRLCNSD